ncbi:MAG: hypothetical protein ACJAUA_000996 [Zhongshania aliphaticivorans]|jgi:hypothetical protein
MFWKSYFENAESLKSEKLKSGRVKVPVFILRMKAHTWFFVIRRIFFRIEQAFPGITFYDTIVSMP